VAELREPRRCSYVGGSVLVPGGRIGGDGGVRDGDVAGGGGAGVGEWRRGEEGETGRGHVSGVYLGRLREGDVDEWCVQGSSW